jgi:hypothetical protein
MALPRVLDGLRTATPGLTLIPVVGAELSTAVDAVVKMSEMLGVSMLTSVLLLFI